MHLLGCNCSDGQPKELKTQQLPNERNIGNPKLDHLEHGVEFPDDLCDLVESYELRTFAADCAAIFDVLQCFVPGSCRPRCRS